VNKDYDNSPPVMRAKNRIICQQCQLVKAFIGSRLLPGAQPTMSTCWFSRAMLCKRGICHCCVSVCHITVLYQMSKQRMTQIMPHDSPGTLVFWRQRSQWNSNTIAP